MISLALKIRKVGREVGDRPGQDKIRIGNEH